MAKNTVFAGDARYIPQVAEALAGAASITPAHLLIKDSSGDFIKHNIEGQAGRAYLADLNTVKQGGMEDAYTDGDTMEAFELCPGDFHNVRVAASNNITAKDTALTSNGDGTLKISATDGTETPLFYADEIVNTGASVTLVRCRVATFGINTDTTV